MREKSAEIIPIDSPKMKLRMVLKKCFPDLDERRKEWTEGAESRKEKFIREVVSEIDKQFLNLLIKLPDREIYKTGVSLALNPNEDFAMKGKRSYQLRENLKLDAWLRTKGFLEAEKRLRQKYPDFQINISLIRIDTDETDFTHVQVGFKIDLKQETNNRCQIYDFGGKNKLK